MNDRGLIKEDGIFLQEPDILLAIVYVGDIRKQIKQHRVPRLVICALHFGFYDLVEESLHFCVYF